MGRVFNTAPGFYYQASPLIRHWAVIILAVAVLSLFACVPVGQQMRTGGTGLEGANNDGQASRAVVRDSSGTGRRVALVIGNGEYRSGRLLNPVNDATDMSNALGRLGFQVIIRFNADRRTMMEAMDLFYRELGQADVGLFYYAGHGMQVGGENYLVPVGSTMTVERDVEYEAVPVGRLLGRMEEAQNRTNIVILDACRDNPFARSFRNAGQGLARMDAPVGSFLAFATSPGATAADGGGRNGIFTGALLQYMTQPGLKIEDVLKSVRRKVVEESSGRQIPWQASSLMGDFYFASGAGASETASSTPQTSSSPLPAAPVSPSAPAPSSVSADLAQLVKQREQSRSEWAAWQSRMESEFRKLEGYEKQSLLSEAEKESGWASFLSSYASDNEFSDQDEALRQKARARESYWKQKAYEAEQAKISAERQKLDQERQRLSEEQERQRLEEERRRLAEEKARLEEDRRQAALAAQRRKLEEERLKLEEERSRLNRPSGPSFTNSIGQKFVLIPGGSFLMGSPAGEAGRDDDETQHRVTLSSPFYIQTTEVTQGQWQGVMGRNPSRFKGDPNLPVEYVSWNDAQEFIRLLNQKEGTDKYRLPTEAEWEYACRAGSTTLWCFGDDENRLGDYAWYDDNSGRKTHPVGRLKPNTWGLYDMHGNVWEWCIDRYGVYPSGSVIDPAGPSSGSYRVFRGGSWGNNARICRSANRHGFDPGYRFGYLGFRLARTK